MGIDGCWQADSQRILNEVMVEHFFRQGMLDVAEELCQVTSVDVEGYPLGKVKLCQLPHLSVSGDLLFFML